MPTKTNSNTITDNDMCVSDTDMASQHKCLFYSPKKACHEEQRNRPLDGI